jgi:hypothetical protein
VPSRIPDVHSLKVPNFPEIRCPVVPETQSGGVKAEYEEASGRSIFVPGARFFTELRDLSGKDIRFKILFTPRHAPVCLLLQRSANLSTNHRAGGLLR